MGAVGADGDGVEVRCLSHAARLGQRDAACQPRRPVADPAAEAPRDCPLCPRLVAFAEGCRAEHPDWWNAPVPAFGDPDAWLAIVGLAPGKHGANRTGRPFTGDYAGDLLYATLAKFGLAEGEYGGDRSDGLRLNGAIILNTVKCLPPQNKPLPSEIANCRHYLEASLAALPNVTVLVALGQIAHVAAARALGLDAVRREVRPWRRARRARTAASCCRAIIARATTRTRGGWMRRCSRVCSSERSVGEETNQRPR